MMKGGETIITTFMFFLLIESMYLCWLLGLVAMGRVKPDLDPMIKKKGPSS